MKNLISILSLTLVFTLSVNAQILENSTLWKIEGNGLKQPSYLFGTIHITCDATIEEDVKKALDATGQVVLELDMDDPNLQAQMMQGMYMKESKTLKDLVSDEDYAAIDSLFIKNMGMSVQLMQNVKPFFLTATLYPKLLDCPMQSFEGELVKIAKEQNEEVKGLETINDQMQVFDDIPYEAQVKDLVRSAKDNLAYDKAMFAKMLKVYKEENITAMIEMMNDENYSAVADYQDKLLDNRNENWIPKIGEFAKDQPTFFGVGAGHLAGDKGVINLLREAGYKVIPVME
ncbi:TraB/GumN family protein [Winogradskyella sp. DF17]|uniref:TraB/GumN family protein n=1 Tax=Winogradskyella pelagia TaxID=2819984 RepID=A0ABS3T541_9FLAO|nr:TraB/GumN family protein [Winogradskyella sp. DF17]MBO3117384.1 TraB/GumN family protein [Winogradskyella sp. DF17]